MSASVGFADPAAATVNNAIMRTPTIDTVRRTRGPLQGRCHEAVRGSLARMSFETESLPDLLAMTVHELRTPLAVVSGYLRMLAREQGGPLTDKQKKIVAEAERSCDRLTTLVADVRELARLYEDKRPPAEQDVDLMALLAELATNMHEGRDRGVRLEVRGPDRPVIVKGDRARLSAALHTLMYAALRERGEPGAILAQCSTIDNADGIRSVVVAFGPPEMVPELTARAPGETRLFQEYRGGLGMALPMARLVIERHGGAVWSIDGVRAASALRLPLRM